MLVPPVLLVKRTLSLMVKIMLSFPISWNIVSGPTFTVSGGISMVDAPVVEASVVGSSVSPSVGKGVVVDVVVVANSIPTCCMTVSPELVVIEHVQTPSS